MKRTERGELFIGLGILMMLVVSAITVTVKDHDDRLADARMIDQYLTNPGTDKIYYENQCVESWTEVPGYGTH